jgi:hypothetical protein
VFRPTEADPPADQVRRITFVPFLTDGRCVLIEGPGGPALPAGEVLAGEDLDRGSPGNAIGWRPPAGLRFDYVHILLDAVPRARLADLIRHHLAHTVRPATVRLLLSDYAANPSAGHPGAAQTLASLGFRCEGQTSGDDRPGRPAAATAWLTATPAR